MLPTVIMERPFNYTSPSLDALRALGIDASNTELLGAIIGLFGRPLRTFIFSLVKSRTSKLLLAAFMLSFPFQLAVERGNYDLLVFGMCLILPLSMFFSCQKI